MLTDYVEAAMRKAKYKGFNRKRSGKSKSKSLRFPASFGRRKMREKILAKFIALTRKITATCGSGHPSME